ncbi:fukutin-related protein [Schistocerca americana]|uniref:fukutin-related protein n=1 Tax=Schistocerca americana TaxID=7009 RepID=UPI001F4F1FC4|nr:fukutin-related protein [Schistocerca americana]
MRMKLARIVTFFVVILNVIVLFCIWKLLSTLDRGLYDFNQKTDLPPKSTNIFSDDSIVTLVIRRFENFDNDIVGTVESFLHLFPNLKVVVISDVLPYPPFDFRHFNLSSKVKLLDLELRLTDKFGGRNPLLQIDTKYVLFAPDSTRFKSKRTLSRLIQELKSGIYKVSAASFSSRKPAECLKVRVNVRQWYIHYAPSTDNVCEAVTGKHVLLIDRQLLENLPAPFLLPFPEALYIQSSARNVKVKLIHGETVTDGKPLFRSQHLLQKVEQLEAARRQQMFRQFGIKQVIRETGVTEWYGCTRETPRCFGTVVNDMPEYLWQGRWTPPCCLAGLRRTAHHVFKRLEQDGVRYWLEGGTLLGAMRSGDILPWDYDVDIGVLRDDLHLSPWLSGARLQPVIDEDGFVWEKAREGDFFRVQYSPVNHLHVDIFPFYSKNGTMTKDTWFPTHKQDREFPEHFLKPLSTIEFIGRKVSAPNNIRDFLELKFGKGAVENPEYPDPNRLKFSLNEEQNYLTVPEN